MLTIRYHSQFKKDYKRIKRRGLDLTEIELVILILSKGMDLPDRYHSHPLSGNYKGFQECHIHPDWLIIYHIDYDNEVLTLIRTGTHSDLFK